MIVEWVGGPDDGALFECPDGTRSIRLAVYVPPMFGSESDRELITSSVVVPILVRPDGSYVVDYPKGLS